MKKFTKFCLITALLLFIFGCAFCCICGFMGGFVQVEEQTRGRVQFYPPGGFVWGYSGVIWDWDDIPGWDKLLNAPAEYTRTDYSGSEVSDLEIEIGGADLVIQESEDDYIWIKNESNRNVRYGMSGQTFELYDRTKTRFWNHSMSGTIYLYLPKEISFENIDLLIGAGRLDSIALTADEIELEAGAGTFAMEGLTGNDISVNVGAGTATMGYIEADELSVAVGAGKIDIQDSRVQEMSLEVGMGDINMSGAITGNSDLECGMGNINITLDGEEEDYNYNIESALGNVQIGDSKYSGMATEKYKDNNARYDMDVECSMGNITIHFEND